MFIGQEVFQAEKLCDNSKQIIVDVAEYQPITLRQCRYVTQILLTHESVEYSVQLG